MADLTSPYTVVSTAVSGTGFHRVVVRLSTLNSVASTISFRAAVGTSTWRVNGAWANGDKDAGETTFQATLQFYAADGETVTVQAESTIDTTATVAYSGPTLFMPMAAPGSSGGLPTLDANGRVKADTEVIKSADADTAITNRVDASTAAGTIASKLAGVSGQVASQSEALAIQNNTRVRVIIPAVIERPDSGSTAYRLDLYIYDEAGNMEAPDSTPTIAAENQAGADRSANLGAVTLEDAGHYSVTYTITSGHAIEQVRFEWSIVEGGVTRLHGGAAQVVDTTAVDFTASDRTKLETLAADYTTARAAKLDNLDLPVSSRLANADYTAPNNAGITATQEAAEAVKVQTDKLETALQIKS